MGAADIFGIKSQYTWYEGELQISNLLVGGVPNTRSVIRGWLRTQMEHLKDPENESLLQEMINKVIAARRAQDPDNYPSTDDIIEDLMDSKSDNVALNVNGFVRDESGELCLEARCLKAGLKESINSCYPGTEWPGKDKVSKGFRKGAKATFVERVVIHGTRLPLGVKADEIMPTYQPGAVAWIEDRIKHPDTPQGKIHALNRVEVLSRPKIPFIVGVADDFLPRDAWGRVWERLEKIGIGSDRGREDGQFSLTKWKKMSSPPSQA